MCARAPSGLRTFLELRYSEPGDAEEGMLISSILCARTADVRAREGLGHRGGAMQHVSISASQHAPCRVGLSCIFEGMITARFHKLVVVVEVAGERQVLFS